MKKLSSNGVIFAIFIIFTVICFAFRGSGPDISIQILFSVASFLFGISCGFSISNRYTRLNRIKDYLKENDAIMHFLYRSSPVFGSKVQKEIQKLIDEHLIEQIDYYLIDFHKSGKTFLDLFNYLVNLKSSNKEQETLYDKYIDLLDDMTKNRKMVEVLVRSRIQKFEWASLGSLLVLIIFCIIFLNTGEFFITVASILLATSTTILFMMLLDLDTLHWKENSWVWGQLEDLFHELDLLPYYPEKVIQDGRTVLTKGTEIRMVTYPNPYPNIEGKNVRVKKI